jgi:peptidoglycan/xylan/chitin deacetylase (PgdA/CDA1 family)
MLKHVKRTVELLLVRGGATALARRLSRSHSLILAYHNVVPDLAEPRGEANLHLPRRRFAAQLDLLARTHEIVDLDSLLHAPSGRRWRPLAAITFDDAYRGALTCGLDELAARRLPATVFVAPARLGADAFWWDALADSTGKCLPGEVRRRALDELAGRQTAVVRWASETGLRLDRLPDSLLPVTEDELRKAVGRARITLASHGWSHANLARLLPEELEDELARPLRWLRERFRAVRPWLAYPYGISSPRVERAAAAAGYEVALRVEGGRLRPQHVDRYALPRMNVPGQVSLEGFRLRTAGLIS